MRESSIVHCGGGPKIAGTRITVYTILYSLRAGRTRDWIAATLGLSSGQVQTAIDYIDSNQAEVNASYGQILERIGQGNPAPIESRLHVNREKLRARLAEQQAAFR